MRIALTLVLLLSLAALSSPGPWFLGMDGGVYQGLKRDGLATARSLVVRGDSPYVIGDDQRVWSGDTQGHWKPLPGLAKGTKLALDGSGNLYLLGLDQGVYGARGRIGLGLAQDLAASTADLFVIGTDSKVWVSRNAGGDWQPYNPLALGKRIAASLDGTVYILGTDAGVYRVGPDKIDRLGLATGQEITVTDSGQPAIVGLDNGVYLFGENGWTRLGSGTARLAVWPR